MFEIPAGGRRFRALELLVKQKRLAKTAPVPFLLGREGRVFTPKLAKTEDVAVGKVRRDLDPFPAFGGDGLGLRLQLVGHHLVDQRHILQPAAVVALEQIAQDHAAGRDIGVETDELSPLVGGANGALSQHATDGVGLLVVGDLQSLEHLLLPLVVAGNSEGHQLVERHAVLGIDVEQGRRDGSELQSLLDHIDRDEEGGGYLLLRLPLLAQRQEGPELIQRMERRPLDVFGQRILLGDAALTHDAAARDALQAEFDRLSEEYAGADDLPDAVDERLSELETALEGFTERPVVFDPDDVARAGAFVSIASDGGLRVERGYVRPEDELPVAPEADPAADDDAVRAVAASYDGGDVRIAAESISESEEDEGLSPLSDRLMAELTARRTLGLGQALGERPDVAFLAALHALTLKTFYHYGSDSCLELDLKSVSFAAQSPGLNDSASVRAIRVRHETWASALPKESADLWAALQDWDGDSRAGLFAHVVSLSVNAVHESWNRRPRALAHADHLAQAVDLDMVAAGWTPTVDNFLGRVTKARILQAVAEGKGQRAADRIEHLKKGEMAAEAETLLADTGWLPEPLRTPGQGAIAESPATESAVKELQRSPAKTNWKTKRSPLPIMAKSPITSWPPNRLI